jgi:hypothetical protein
MIRSDKNVSGLSDGATPDVTNQQHVVGAPVLEEPLQLPVNPRAFPLPARTEHEQAFAPGELARDQVLQLLVFRPAGYRRGGVPCGAPQFGNGEVAPVDAHL